MNLILLSPKWLPDPALATATRVTPHELFEERLGKQKIQDLLEPVVTKLRGLHLMYSDSESRCLARPFWVAFALIGGVGGAKLLLGFARGRPIGFLFMLMIIAYIAWNWARNRKVHRPTELESAI